MLHQCHSYDSLARVIALLPLLSFIQVRYPLLPSNNHLLNNTKVRLAHKISVSERLLSHLHSYCVIAPGFHSIKGILPRSFIYSRSCLIISSNLTQGTRFQKYLPFFSIKGGFGSVWCWMSGPILAVHWQMFMYDFTKKTKEVSILIKWVLQKTFLGRCLLSKVAGSKKVVLSSAILKLQ
ncbi:hypothetical protein FGO68_gene5902 [Halteria grandinella]|uniref:Uncharacterized protein n=1 Tax=Halteria grandinella TaxID=5974 RepID=A0A8J8NI10_HALGN|nr:hypothetical protein FGO68_gene5902 [Halteria grandinella]